MSLFQEQRLGDVIEVKHGFAFEGRYFVEDGPYVLLTPGNFREAGGFRDRGDKQKFYDGPVPPDFVLKPGDILVAMTEQGEGLLGSAAFVPVGKPCLHNQRLGLIRSKAEAAVHLPYIYYLFNSRPVRAQIRSSSNGAKVRHTSPTRICAVVVPMPKVQIQRRIASVLRAYDDLIEVNRRRIALLEEMARRLFEEWFVYFRFPRHEDTEIIHTPDGLLPQGWAMRNIGNISAYLSRGIAPNYDETASTLVVGQKCIRDQRLSLSSSRRQSRSVPSEKLVSPGDILINSTGVGTLGRVAQVESVPDGLTVDTHVTIVRPNPELDRDFFGLALLRMQPTFERMGAGATGQTELNRGRIADVALAVPPKVPPCDFGKLARPLRVLSFELARQNEILKYEAVISSSLA